jgi:hypothetical protein
MENPVALLLFGWILFAGLVPAQDRVAAEKLLNEITRLWSWEQYWHGEFAAQERFRPGIQDRVILVERAGEVLLCSAKLHLAELYRRASDGSLQSISTDPISGASALTAGCQEAYSRMRSMRSTVAGRKPGVGATAAYSPPAPQPPEAALDLSTVIWNETEVVWPRLPRYAISSSERVDNSSLLDEVRYRLRAMSKCADRLAVIPKYTIHDPSVFVLVTDVDCADAVLEFARGEGGRWTSVAKYTAAQTVRNLKKRILRLESARVQ